MKIFRNKIPFGCWNVDTFVPPCYFLFDFDFTVLLPRPWSINWDVCTDALWRGFSLHIVSPVLHGYSSSSCLVFMVGILVRKYLNRNQTSWTQGAEAEKVRDPGILDPRKDFHLAESFLAFLMHGELQT